MTERGADREVVCVTGVGAVTPLGMGADALHDRWASGTCASDQGVARCVDFAPDTVLSRKQLRRLDRFAQFAVCAAHEALTQAGWIDELPGDPFRIGCIIGTGGGTTSTLEQLYEVHRRGNRRMSPLGVTMAMANAAAAAITLAYGLHGESFGVTAACSAGSQAIGIGMRLIQHGHLDAVVVGGADACVTDWSYNSLLVMGSLSTSGVIRPFDRNRDGMVLGEGGGVLVLERLTAARQRDAPILAQALGYGATSDAFHITRPDPEGTGPARAIESALLDAGVPASAIDYVNAHGTGTRLNDPSETRALKHALGGHAYAVPISAPKSAIGHLIGGAGAVESVATISALRARVAPPTLNLIEPDDGLDLDYVPRQARALPDANVKPRLLGLNNSFAFGGHNAALVFAVDA
jgi:3-oxoacyl-[acyl-carrier-protein] synthase II